MNFWDSSAVIEAHDGTSPKHGRFVNLLQQKTLQAASRLILPEVLSALARRNRQNRAQADLVLTSARGALAHFSLYTVSDDLVDAAVEIGLREHLKGADAVHLATAEFVARALGRKGFALVTLDKELGAAARRRGLRVIGS